jgi:hypothetical protein
MFSLSKGLPIGIISKGKFKDNHLGVLSREEFDKKCCKNRGGDCEFQMCCENCTFDPMDSDDIVLNSSFITPCPNPNVREVLYICGPSGVGKSTLASQYIKEYKKLFPNNEVIIFSRKPKDDVLDKLKPLRFIIDESIVTEPIDVLNEDEFKKGCLVLFDDCNTFQNDKIKKAVSKLMSDILEIGRSAGIYIIITSHLVNPNEKKDSRTIWNEAHCVVMFPRGGNKHGMEYAMKNYLGYDKNTIAKIFNLNSRYALMSKQYPNYVLHEHGGWIVK